MTLSGCDGADYLTLPSFNLFALVLCTVKLRRNVGGRLDSAPQLYLYLYKLDLSSNLPVHHIAPKTYSIQVL